VVQDRKSHIRRADLNGQEVVAEAALWRGGEHEENHDGAMHGHQSEISLRLDVSQKRQDCGGRDQMNAHQQREEHADKHRSQREEVILEADDFMIETEDPLSNEPLGARVRVRFLGSEFVSCHIIASRPPVPPTICRILPD